MSLTNMLNQTFGHVAEKQIIKVFRVDTSEDYEFYMPYGVLLMFDQTDGLYFGATNDGNSIDIRVTTYKDIYDNHGIEFSEAFINELKKEDELNHLIGQTITELKIAEYKSQNIKGDGFIIRQGKYAGLILKAGSMTISFNNNHGGYLWTDQLIQEFPNADMWTWTESETHKH